MKKIGGATEGSPPGCGSHSRFLKSQQTHLRTSSIDQGTRILGIGLMCGAWVLGILPLASVDSSQAAGALSIASSSTSTPSSSSPSPPTSTSTSPYIDLIQQEIKQADAEDTSSSDPRENSFIESRSQELLKQDALELSEHPDLFEPMGPDASVDSAKKNNSFIKTIQESDEFKESMSQGKDLNQPFLVQEQKALVEKAQKKESLIESVQNGTNARVRAEKVGNIHHLFGFKYGVGAGRLVSGGVSDFESVYGGQYAPEFSFSYEYQPFHSEILGNIGILGNVGVGYFRGLGRFTTGLPKPSGIGGTFDGTSTTDFVFVAFPITIGAVYRFNLFHYLRPYIMAGPTVVLFNEGRDDDVAGNRGFSKSISVSVGCSILLDFMNRRNSWEMYQMMGIHHYYLVVDYTRLIPFPGGVLYGSSGVSLGLAMEF